MPFGNGTGPAGLGPMTGRAAGYCAGYPVPGFMNPIPGRFGFAGAPAGYPAAAGWPGQGALPYVSTEASPRSSDGAGVEGEAGAEASGAVGVAGSGVAGAEASAEDVHSATDVETFYLPPGEKVVSPAGEARPLTAVLSLDGQERVVGDLGQRPDSCRVANERRRLMPTLPEVVSKAWDDREGPVVLATVSSEGVPNAIYAGCARKFSDEKLVVADNFFEKTRANILAGSRSSILFITKGGKSFQVKGGVERLTEGEIYDDMKLWSGDLPGHAAAVLSVEEVYSGAEKLL